MSKTEKMGLALMMFGFFMLIYLGDDITDGRFIFYVCEIVFGGIMFAIIGGDDDN